VFSLFSLTEDYSKEIGLANAEGALVGAVVADSPAQKAGIMVGDVIIKVADKKITTASDLYSAIESTPIGNLSRFQSGETRVKFQSLQL